MKVFIQQKHVKSGAVLWNYEQFREQFCEQRIFAAYRIYQIPVSRNTGIESLLPAFGIGWIRELLY